MAWRHAGRSCGNWRGLLLGGTGPAGEGEDEAYRQAHPGWVPGQPKEGEDTRNWWQRHMPKAVGGKDAPMSSPLPHESITFWRSKGYSDAAIAGLLTQEQSESDYQTHNVGDAGSARGSFQWHRDRRDRILATTGIDVYSQSTTHLQMLQAAEWELHNSHKAAGDRIRGASTAFEAGYAGSKYYEGAAGRSGAENEARRRGNLASVAEFRSAELHTSTWA